MPLAIKKDDVVVPDIVGDDEYDGATPTPPEIRTDPVATSANFDSAVVLEAKRRSPTV